MEPFKDQELEDYFQYSMSQECIKSHPVAPRVFCLMDCFDRFHFVDKELGADHPAFPRTARAREICKRLTSKELSDELDACYEYSGESINLASQALKDYLLSQYKD